MPRRTQKKRIIWMTTGMILVSALLFYGTIHIPLGKTPEDAVQQFRHFSAMQVIHREPVDGGILLFIKQFYQKDVNDLQIEYVRETWLGWKWVWGGGYGIGESLLTKAALTYMSIPEVEGISTPFPIVFGDVLDPLIKKVTIVTNGQGG